MWLIETIYKNNLFWILISLLVTALVYNHHLTVWFTIIVGWRLLAVSTKPHFHVCSLCWVFVLQDCKVWEMGLFVLLFWWMVLWLKGFVLSWSSVRLGPTKFWTNNKRQNFLFPMNVSFVRWFSLLRRNLRYEGKLPRLRSIRTNKFPDKKSLCVF